MSMTTSEMTREIKILTPIGMLGYSFSQELFWQAIEDGVDAIILDSGSTDSGPSRLALGHSGCTREGYENDLKVLVAACHFHKVPLLIGSAGGDGTNAHVEFITDIVTDIIAGQGYRSMKVVTILADIPKSTVTEKFRNNLIVPCSSAVPELQQTDIDDASVIVAQMGYEPWLKALQDHPDADIIVGGRSYDPAPYAAFCVHKGFPDLGLAYHMGKIMECGAVCALPKSAEALATVRDGSFDIRPLNPRAKCTPLSVAAHTLYEKTRPDLLAGPGGVLDVSGAAYEALEDGRTTRVRGSKFVPVPWDKYTVKLEGARIAGYKAIFIGSIRDPILVAQLDGLIPLIEERLHKVLSFDFELEIHLYGKDLTLPDLGFGRSSLNGPREVGVLGKVVAETQDRAKTVASLAKTFFIHAPYPGQVATAGNFQMPLSPCDLAIGPCTEFCLYHLMQINDPTEVFPIHARTVVGSGSAGLKRITGLEINGSTTKPTSTSQSTTPENPPFDILSALQPPPPPGFTYLATLATVIRSKNAGPYELTLDIMFEDKAKYDRVRKADVLTKESIMELYGIQRAEHLLACMWWEPALAFKATVRRPYVSGSFRDGDVHGSGAHVPLMYLLIPQ